MRNHSNFLNVIVVVAVFIANSDGATLALKDMGRSIDRMTRELEEYGTISISAPLFTEAGDDFKFDLRRGATNYYSDALTQIQGGAALSEQAVQSFSGQVQGQYDPTLVGAYANKLGEFVRQRGLADRRQSLLETASEAQLQADLAKALAMTNAVERAQAEAAARVAYAQRAPGGSNAPAYPTAASVNAELPGLSSNKLDRPDVRDTLTSTQFTGFQGLLGTAFGTNFSPRVNNRSALITAGGDVAVEAIFRLLGQPQKAGEYMGKELMFGAATVAVNPGWRTRKGFAANVAAMVHIEYRPARREVVDRVMGASANQLSEGVRIRLGDSYDYPASQLAAFGLPTNATHIQIRATKTNSDSATVPNIVEKIPFDWDYTNAPSLSPLVFAVSPMTDVETLDLASSTRRQNELVLALALSYAQAGMSAQGNFLEQFVKRREGDFRTRNAIAAVNSYSMSGGLFGFEIGPRFRAVNNLDNPKPKSGEVLDRQTFPVLLIVGVDKASLRPFIKRVVDGTNESFQVMEPVMRIVQMPRWAPLKHSVWCWNNHPQSFTEHLEWSRSINHQWNALKTDTSTPDSTAALASNRWYAIKTELNGSFQDQRFNVDKLFPPLPPATKAVLPEITDMFPQQVELKRRVDGSLRPVTVKVALAGRHLGRLDLTGLRTTSAAATLTGTPRLVSGVVVLELTITSADTPVAFQIPVKHQDGLDNNDGPPTIFTTPLLLKPEPEKVAGAPQAAVPIIRTIQKVAGDQSQREFTVEVQAQASEAAVNAARQIIAAEIEKAKPVGGSEANVSVNVQAQEKK